MDIIKDALSDYRKIYRCTFGNLKAWEVVRDRPKWFEGEPMNFDLPHAPKRSKTSESSHGFSESDTNPSPRSIPTGSSNLPDLNENATPTGPRRKGKNPTASGSSKLDDAIAEQQAIALAKKAQHDLLIEDKREVLKLQKRAILDRQLKSDMEIFGKPLEEFPAYTHATIIERKQQIAEERGWKLP